MCPETFVLEKFWLDDEPTNILNMKDKAIVY